MRTRTRDIFRTILTFVLFTFWIGMYVVTHLPPEWVKKPAGWSEPKLLAYDKIFHLGAYCVLSTLFCFWMWLGRMPRPKHFLFCWTVLLAYAAFEEVTQGPFNRSVELNDWLTDVAGTTIGCVITFVFWRIGPTWFSSKQRWDDHTPIVPVELEPHSK
ncbi:MAG: VanZ family protein [Pirellulales bacterium]